MSRASAAFEHYPDTPLLLSWLLRRFGMPADAFAAHRFWHRPGTPSVWVAAQGCTPPRGLYVETLGMLVMREAPPRGKPTSVFLQRFGAAATRNVYVLDADRADVFLAGGTVEVDPVDDAKGFAVVRTPARVLGCGVVEGEKLHSALPRAWLATP